MVKRYRGKVVEGRGCGKFGVISCHLCGGTEEYHAKTVRMIDLSDEISTMNLQNTNQGRDIRSCGMLRSVYWNYRRFGTTIGQFFKARVQEKFLLDTGRRNRQLSRNVGTNLQFYVALNSKIAHLSFTLRQKLK